MRGMKIKSISVIFFTAMILLLIYQNCSPMGNSSSSLLANSSNNNGQPTIIPPEEPPLPETPATEIFSFPAFADYRTDYNTETEGTSANPLTLSPCSSNFSVEAWQTSLCNGSDSAQVYPHAFSYNLNRNLSRYWVLSVNHEPAFKVNNNGPPNQSLAINSAGAIMSVNAIQSGFEIGIDSRLANAQVPEGNPFLSYGLQVGRGVTENYILPNSRYIFSFDLTLTDTGHSNPNIFTGSSIHFWIETQHQGVRQFSWIFLGERNTLSFPYRHFWNWPISESMWSPGAQIAFINSTHYQTCQSIPVINLYTPSVGSSYHYDLDFEKLVTCLSLLPSDTKITGIHFALEQNFTRQAQNWVKIKVQNLKFSDKATSPDTPVGVFFSKDNNGSDIKTSFKQNESFYSHIKNADANTRLCQYVTKNTNGSANPTNPCENSTPATNSSAWIAIPNIGLVNNAQTDLKTFFNTANAYHITEAYYYLYKNGRKYGPAAMSIVNP